MTTLLLIISYLGCVSSGAMLSMLLLLISAYITAAIWLISHGAIYSGLLYVLVYVGAIVVLIMFVVQLTNTSLTVTGSSVSTTLIVIQNTVNVICLSLLLVVAYGSLNSDLIFNISSFNLDDQLITNNVSNSPTSYLEYLDSSSNTLGTLASSIFNEYGYVLVLSVHAIILAVIGPIKLALSDYFKP